ncbi:uncharacterized protein LOC135160725 [Diachasmimorpha longicaudata]|uniref:uncharacterized protein LOC135160725 n=1 Tax=Diachasmimorpha longicaudata TaxID=58733 RepID=UPI0030B8D1F4
MKCLSIFLIFAAVMFALASAKYVGYQAKENNLYNRLGKKECKRVKDCQELYGNNKIWTCIKGECRELQPVETDDDDDDSAEQWHCTPEKCNLGAEPGVRYTCNTKGHCVEVRELLTPDRHSKH